MEKAYELEAEYEGLNGHDLPDDEEPRPTGYLLHKEMVGARCQNIIRLVMRLDAHRGVVSRSIEGGEFVEFTDCE